MSEDFLDKLNTVALAYLRRRTVMHLSEQQLFSTAVDHLITTTDCTRQTAENTVARAYGELRSEGEPRYLDITNSTANVAMIVDPNSGMTWPVPISLILQQVIDTPQRRRLSLVNLTTKH
ncbi:MAG: hypothetical protein Q8K97_07565 [Pseudohongiella sp.]|nr:hypothetical protein [Pseudohongiella sp.]